MLNFITEFILYGVTFIPIFLLIYVIIQFLNKIIKKQTTWKYLCCMISSIFFIKSTLIISALLFYVVALLNENAGNVLENWMVNIVFINIQFFVFVSSGIVVNFLINKLPYKNWGFHSDFLKGIKEKGEILRNGRSIK